MDRDQDQGSRGYPPGAGLGLGSGFGGISSPYLNFDPSVISPGGNQSEWIFPDGGVRHSRGRFELAFSQIGGSVMTGAALGGLIGGYNGLKWTSASLLSPANAASAPNISWSVRRSQILNYITKTGANTGNTFGIVALLYSVFGVALSFVNETNDDLNTIVAGTATGLVFRGLSVPKPKEGAAASTVMASKLPIWQLRMRRSVGGGLVGLGLSVAYVLATNRDKFIKSEY